MSGSSVVPVPLGHEVGQELGGVQVAHPVEGVRAHAHRARCARAVAGLACGGDVTAGTLLPDAGRAGTRPWRVGSLAVPVAAQPAAADDEQVTFTVALLNEVDSFNPFKGVEAPSYEAWALMYDLLVGYSMKDMSPAPALATDVGLDRRRADLDLRHPRGREVVRRRAADRGRHRLHLQPHPRRRPGGTHVGVLPDLGRDGHRAGREDRGAAAVEAQRRAAAAADPDPARARLEGRAGGRCQDASRNEPRGRPAGRRVGAVPPRRGHRGRLDVRLREEPRLLGRRRRTSTGSPSGSIKSEDPAIQALIKGEVDFVARHHPAPGQGAAGPRRDHRAINGVSPYFEEIAFNTGAVDTEDRQAASATATRR